MIHWRHGWAIAASLALTACGDAGDTGSGATSGDGADGGAKPEVIAIDALGSSEWNLASLGRKGERSYLSSKGSGIDIEDLWLIERATGATFDLVPDGLGAVTQSYFISGEIGPLASFNPYNATAAQADETPLEFYVLLVASGKKQTALYAGSLAEKDTMKLGGPYASILHLEMLSDNRLALYAKRDDAVQRVVFDLETMKQAEEAEVRP